MQSTWTWRAKSHILWKKEFPDFQETLFGIVSLYSRSHETKVKSHLLFVHSQKILNTKLVYVKMFTKLSQTDNCMQHSCKWCSVRYLVRVIWLLTIFMWPYSVSWNPFVNMVPFQVEPMRKQFILRAILGMASAYFIQTCQWKKSSTSKNNIFRMYVVRVSVPRNCWLHLKCFFWYDLLKNLSFVSSLQNSCKFNDSGYKI